MTTIIITTHYIEEAKKSNCLGFMREGAIIEENSPEYLMTKYNQNVTKVFMLFFFILKWTVID